MHFPTRSVAGFTLIEMLVVIGIMMMMSTILLAYNKTSDRKLLLSVEQAKIVGLLNRAKSFALESRSGNGVSDNACAFGVHLTQTPTPVAILFQDLREDPQILGCRGRYADGSTFPNYNLMYQPWEKLETLDIDPRITFGFSGPPIGSADIVFQPPFLETSVSGLGIPDGIFPFTVSLGIQGETLITRVEVGSGGQVTSL